MSDPGGRPAGGISHVALLGLMGSGKSTVGSALAVRLGWPVSDSDAWIVERTGRTAREIMVSDGVRHLWDLEAEHLLTAVDQPGPLIVCVAASAIEDSRCRAALGREGVLAIWLRARPATVAGRFRSAQHRPSFGSDPSSFLAVQAGRRRPLFEDLRPVTIDVDVDERSPDEVAALAMEAIGRAGAPGR